jgi:hypothetical protein
MGEATAIVGPSLYKRMMRLIPGLPKSWDDDRLMVKIVSDDLPQDLHGRHVEVVEEPDGSFRFKAADYGYET